MKKPNVFWISIDSLRRDFLSIYNRHAMRSTYLDEIAEQGCIFEDAFPGGNWTIPSHATMLTGLDATSHMIWGWEHRFAPETETAFDLFRRAGYTTGCFAIPELRSLFSSPQIDYQGSADHPALFRCLDSQEPFFVFWHTYNVHYPYGMKAPSYFDFRTQDIDYDAGGPTMTYLRHLVVSERVDLITDSYRSEVQKVARFIKTVAGKLRSLGKLENTYFILTSDHGEAWRINGMFHCNFLEEVLRVPLAIVGPGIPARRTSTPVGHSSLLPTIVELCELDCNTDEMFDGQSIRSAISGGSAGDEPLIIGGPSGPRCRHAYIAVRHKQWMLIKALDSYLESFHRVENDGLSPDLSIQAIPDEGTRLLEELRSIAGRHIDRFASGSINTVPLSQETHKKLRALGYV